MDRRDWSILIVSILLILLVGALAVVLPMLPFHRAQEILERPAGTIPAVPTEVPVLSPGGTPLPGTQVVQGPPAFRLLVTPVEVRARPGEAVLYSMTVEPEGGYDEPVSLRLDVRALFLYQESFSLGTIDPPFPRTVQYRFVVPPDVPSGITVSGVLTGEGGDSRDTVSLILIIT